jgi:tRNA-dihydrouridine synthase B
MKTKIFMAPMSGITDLPFRLICRQFGARHCFFEMLDAKAVLSNHPKNKRRLKTLRKDSPISAQLVGSDIGAMIDAAHILTSEAKLSFLDINAACPAPKVIKKGAGAALLKDNKRLSKIIKSLNEKLDIPITVKLRSGFERIDTEKCVETAKACRDSGASIIFIHGRCARQGYSGTVDYASIKAVKDALDIPVVGSGDVVTPPLAKKMLDETGVDGILIARGALGNPWIFKDVESYLKRGRLRGEPGLALKKKTLMRHLAYVEKYKDISPSDKIGFMNKIAMWYLKGLPNARRIRDKIARARSYKVLSSLIHAS